MPKRFIFQVKSIQAAKDFLEYTRSDVKTAIMYITVANPTFHRCTVFTF